MEHTAHKFGYITNPYDATEAGKTQFQLTSVQVPSSGEKIN